eukprot:6058198-Amphidinium_carterae.1
MQDGIICVGTVLVLPPPLRKTGEGSCSDLNLCKWGHFPKHRSIGSELDVVYLASECDMCFDTPRCHVSVRPQPLGKIIGTYTHIYKDKAKCSNDFL